MTYKQKQQRIPAQNLKVGDVFLESHLNTARVVRITRLAAVCIVGCRYTWQAASEAVWIVRLGSHESVTKVHTWPTSTPQRSTQSKGK